MNQPRKLHIKSFGCQMNAYDSHRMADLLAPEGYVECDTPAEADLVILNTCHIRERAVEKVYSELGRLRDMQHIAAGDGRRMRVAVAGCVAQAEGEEIIRRAKGVDLVVGSQNYHRLPGMLARVEIGERVVDTEFPAGDRFNALPAQRRDAIRKRGVSAFLTVQEGCDKFCNFCVVPYTRGIEISRPAVKIVAEAERLAESGVREITLIGQNVNGYHGEDEAGRAMTLACLLERVAAVPGVARLRYTTSHPLDMDEALIAAHRDMPKLAPHIHLPVQSGSNRILDAMNRRHTRADYLAIVERLRAARPDIAFSSDFIVGFPGETDAEFNDTLALVDDVGFGSAYTFMYSPRPGTPAASMDAQVPDEVKQERLRALQAAIERQKAKFNAACRGRTMDVLFEKEGRLPGQIVGRSPYLQPVPVFGPPSLIGELAAVTIVDVGFNLVGELASPGLATPEPAIRNEPAMATAF